MCQSVTVKDPPYGASAPLFELMGGLGEAAQLTKHTSQAGVSLIEKKGLINLRYQLSIIGKSSNW